MFKKLIKNFHELRSQNQILVTLIIIFAAICVTWGAEKLLDVYFFPKKPVVRYVIAVLGGLIVLYMLKYILLYQV